MEVARCDEGARPRYLRRVTDSRDTPFARACGLMTFRTASTDGLIENGRNTS
jgi:hypothetical protein